jgi:hypothetical protein
LPFGRWARPSTILFGLGRRTEGGEGEDEGEEKEGGEVEIGGLGRLEDDEDLEKLEEGGGRRGRDGLGEGEGSTWVLAIGRAKLIPIGSLERTFPRGGDA